MPEPIDLPNRVEEINVLDTLRNMAADPEAEDQDIQPAVLLVIAAQLERIANDLHWFRHNGISVFTAEA